MARSRRCEQCAVTKFQQAQQVFISHLRAPALNPAPADIEDRRMGIYRDLVYNNIAGFIAGAFPVVKSLLSESCWQVLVRDFIVRHQCKTPYFLEISQEFLAYLSDERGLCEGDPAFLLELAHYEWVELALDVAEEDLPALRGAELSLMDNHPKVSPLAWPLAYQFPVHKIGPGFQPRAAEQTPVFLVAYRERTDSVKFMEINSLTYALLGLLHERPELSGRAALETLAAQIQHPDPLQLMHAGELLLQQLFDAEIIVGIEEKQTGET